MTECNDCVVPPVDIIEHCVDLDMSAHFSPGTTKADCIVFYQNEGSFLMECKTSYIKRAVLQFEGCVNYLQSSWAQFLSTENLPQELPFPTNFIIYIENGIGNEKGKYEIERNSKKLKIRKNGYAKVNNSGTILVYTAKDVSNMKNNLTKFGGK